MVQLIFWIIYIPITPTKPEQIFVPKKGPPSDFWSLKNTDALKNAKKFKFQPVWIIGIYLTIWEMANIKFLYFVTD